MEFGIKFAWLILGLIHLPPAAVWVSPSLINPLYGIAPNGTVGLLMTHRGALFLALVVLAVFAAFDAQIRRAAAVMFTISIVGFLFVYGRAGFPSGALRSIAIVDGGALIPLAFVSLRAFKHTVKAPPPDFR